MVSPNRHPAFGYVFYNNMNQKPVAQSVLWHITPEKQAVYGLLSLCVTAIVVNYFVFVPLRTFAKFTGYTLSYIEVRDV